VAIASTMRQLVTSSVLVLMATSPIFLGVQPSLAQNKRSTKALSNVPTASDEHGPLPTTGFMLPAFCPPLALCFPTELKSSVQVNKASLLEGLRQRFDPDNFPDIFIHTSGATKPFDTDDYKIQIDVTPKSQLTPLEVNLLAFRLKLIASNIVHTKVDQIEVTVLQPNCFIDRSKEIICSLAATDEVRIKGSSGDALIGTTLYQYYSGNNGNLDSIPDQKLVQNISPIKSSAERFFASYNHKLEITEEDPAHIVFLVPGIKNAVLKGQNLWEKLQFYIVKQQSGDMGKYSDYFIVSDGFYTGGIGKEPPISSYTNPFEPKYFEQLQTFTKEFGIFVKNDLER
jgi:hypothetical protein